MVIIVVMSGSFMSARPEEIPAKNSCSFSAIGWKFVMVCRLVASMQDVTCVPTICVAAVVVAGAVVAVFARLLVMMGLIGLFSTIIFKTVGNFLKFGACVPSQFVHFGASLSFLVYLFAL